MFKSKSFVRIKEQDQKRVKKQTKVWKSVSLVSPLAKLILVIGLKEKALPVKQAVG
jgi:hypothetical protein